MLLKKSEFGDMKMNIVKFSLRKRIAEDDPDGDVDILHIVQEKVIKKPYTR